MDAYRADGELVLCFDLPGLTRDAIELDVQHTVLTVKAERRPPVTDENARTLVTERVLGVFSRQVVLGEGFDTGRTAATYDNGVLTVRIPLAGQSPTRRIPISGGES